MTRSTPEPSSSAGTSVANRDASLECLEIARRALSAGDMKKAEKFGEKALKLYRSKEAEQFVEQLRSSSTNGSHQAAAGPGSSSAAGASSAAGVRHRRHGTGHASTSQAETPSASGGPGAAAAAGGAGGGNSSDAATSGGVEVTQEQRELVVRILKSKDYYEILSVSRESNDDEIKRSYRKLALKLHPDKNKAPKSEDAFKAVSRAFSCLSDSDKRAYYDRTGYESSAAAAAASNAAAAGSAGRGGPVYYGDDIDPEELFNMFFGGGFHPNGRMFRTQYAHGFAPPRRGHHQQQQAEQRTAVMGLLQLLPVLLLVFLTIFNGSQEPVWSLMRDSKYHQPLATQRLAVPFFVRNKAEFDSSYPLGSASRSNVERQVESDYYERMQARCQQEKMQQHRMYTWGNKQQAKEMAMPACDELSAMNAKLGLTRNKQRVMV